MEWTAERVALLKCLRDDGVSYTAIAAKLGITRGAVSGKVDRLGLATREPVPRGPRKPRAVLKTRPILPRASDVNPDVLGGQAQPGNSKDLGLVSVAPGVAAYGPYIFRNAPEGCAPQDDGTGDVQCRKFSQDEAAAREPADPLARTSRGCSLLELNEDTCRWPVGDVGEPGFFFCGEPPLKNAPYCGSHCRKAFRPFDARPLSEFVPDRDATRVVQPDTRFGQFAHWDVT